MGTLWLCFGLALLACGTTAQNDDSAFPDYWDDEYDTQWYIDELEKLGIADQDNEEPVKTNDAQNIAQPDAEEDNNNFNDYDNIINQPVNLGEQEKNENDMDKKVEEEIKTFRKENDVPADQDSAFDVNSDYQFEDNRSLPKDEEIIILEEPPVASNEVADNDGSLVKAIEPVIESNEPIERDINDEEMNNDDEPLPKLKEETKGNNDDPQLSPEIDDKKIFEETKNILSEDDNKSNDFGKDLEQENNDQRDQDIVEETRKLLEDTSDTFDENSVDANNGDEEVKKEVFVENQPIDLENDNVDKIYSDLNEDLNKLFDTWEKLKSDNVDVGDVIKQDDALDFDYNKDDGNSQKTEEDYINSFNSFEEADQLRQNPDNLVDIDDLFKDDSIEKQVENKEDDQLSKNVDSKEPNPDDAMDPKPNATQPILYLNDELVANDENDNKKPTEKTTESEVRKMDVDDLSSSELDNLMNQFKVLYSDDLDTESKDFDKNIAVVHMQLSVDEPLIITSPNYPNAYPTNNIVDWQFEGDGSGIEFNIIDFAVNGALGDYVLVKPGGIDASGTDGLVFSYRLDSERRYRFTDVNRMFVRFEARPAMMGMRGFNFTVKLISPPRIQESPGLPEPEKIIPVPNATHTIFLNVVSLRQFNAMREEFRQLLADMADEYIRRNEIEFGQNTTSEVTQITRAGICSINWPDYTNCVEVTFGVPISYGTDHPDRLNSTELSDMWSSYIYVDPFALRLRRMGISEFSPPNDTAVLMIWLVIGFGVLVSVVMLVVALWRFNCFEEYTRMPLYSDTDSIMEKRGLDLYPTPHQTLPSLEVESDHEFDDTTRVDVGGYTNRSYVRDDSFIGSEEVVTNQANPRDRRYATEV